jgi:starch synthase
MNKKSLLFSASEVYPFAKSGGLADVAHSLPRALSDEYTVDVILPLYSSIDRKKFKITTLNEKFEIYLGETPHTVELFGCKYEGIDYIFVYSSLLCDREFLYGTPDSAYEDNALRFGLFNYAILELVKKKSYDIAHLNDWQTALSALLIKEDTNIKTKVLFTIHNLAYQGVFDRFRLQELGLSESYFNIDSLEFYEQISFMKAGIAYADVITTVSPTYSKEILTPVFGCGLDGFLRLHENKLHGIINGIDTEHFSPSKDKFLKTPYKDLRGKRVNKNAYLKEAGLEDLSKPLFIFVGRFTWQKGLDLLGDILEEFATHECNIAIIGDGEEKYQHRLKEIADRHANIHLEFTYDEALSHKMYGAADFLLMPSLFEPCGLNQFIAMSYGALPIVHNVGGLADSVHSYREFDTKSEQAYGISFTHATEQSLSHATQEALELYKSKKDFNKILKHNMLCDFSFEESAKLYSKLYQEII